MKGSAPFIIGMLMVILVTIIYTLGVNQNFSKNLDIATHTSKLYATENNAESLKRSLDSFIYFSMLQSLKQTFENAGEWSESGPFEAQISDSIRGKIKERLDLFSPETIGKSSLVWKDSSARFLILDTGIKASGQKSFTIKYDANPKISIEIPGEFSRNSSIEARKLFQRGRDLFDNNEWSAIKATGDSDLAICQSLADSSETNSNLVTIKSKDKNIIALTLKCGYLDSKGVFALSAYAEDEAKSNIEGGLNALASAINSDRYEYIFAPQISAVKDGSNEKVAVAVSVSIADKNSSVPGQNNFVPLSLKFITKVEFDMAAPAESAGG